MSFWVYLLRCSDGKFYAGHTDALEPRIAAHLAGKGCDFTARRQPVEYLWSQDFGSRIEALGAERQIKGWSRAKKEALIAGDWGMMSQLAQSCGARASTGSARTVEGEPLHRQIFVRPELVEGHATPPMLLDRPSPNPSRKREGNQEP
jgi:predicted GIY-YIG superfamily endonuclease